MREVVVNTIPKEHYRAPDWEAENRISDSSDPVGMRLWQSRFFELVSEMRKLCLADAYDEVLLRVELGLEELKAIDRQSRQQEITMDTALADLVPERLANMLATRFKCLFVRDLVEKDITRADLLGVRMIGPKYIAPILEIRKAVDPQFESETRDSGIGHLVSEIQRG